MHPLAWILALGLLSLPGAGYRAPTGSLYHFIAQDPAPAPAPEPESEALKEARELFARAKEAREREDLDEARAQAAKAVGALVGLAQGSLSAKEDQLLFELGTFSREVGDLKSARLTGERAVRESELRLPADHPDLLRARHNLAVMLFDLGDLSAARALQERVVEVRERTLPPDHPDLMLALQSLANTLKTLGDLKAARELFVRVLEVRERTLPSDDPDLQRARANLGGTLYDLGDLTAARALMERVLEVFERTLPADHPDLASARGGLAITIMTLGDLSGARALFERVLEVRERRLPADHPDLAWARAGLAVTLLNLGDLSTAHALFERVLEVRERTLPADHPDLVAARGNMATTLKSLGDLSGAREYEELVLEVRERTLPADHPHLALARLNLAGTLGKLGDLQAARALEERVLEVRERTLPADHPDLATVRESLAITLITQGDLSAARTLLEQVLEVRERTLPADHLHVAIARLNLAGALKQVGDLRAARALQERVLEVFERTLPADHPHLATVRGNLAATLNTLGYLRAARDLQEQVLEVRERTLPADHPDLAMARQGLAGTLGSLGDLHAARDLQERALEFLERTLPADHPDLAMAQLGLADILGPLGDLRAARDLQERALEVLERTRPDDHPLLAQARGALADTLRRLGELSAARALQVHVLEVRERTLAADHPALARARSSLAGTLVDLGDLSAARALQERVLEVFERTLPADHPDLAATRLNLATTLRILRDPTASRALEEQALEVYERTLPADHPHIAVARGNLAATLGALLGGGDEGGEDEGGRRSALRTLALDLSRGLRRSAQSTLLESSPREVEERLASIDVDLVNAFSLARGYGIVDLGDEVQGEIFLLGESSRAGGLIASRLAARGVSDEVGEELRVRIAVETEELARLAQSGGSAEDLGRARTAIDQTGREFAQHASGLLGSAAAIDPTLEDLTKDLGPADALVAWRRTSIETLQRGDPATWSSVDSLIAFVVRPGVRIDGLAAGKGSPILEMIDLGPAAPVEAAIERWRERIGYSIDRGVAPDDRGVAPDDRGVAVGDRGVVVDSSTPSFVDLGSEVRARVFDPLHGALKGVERVIVVLDDALHAIPLDALPAGDTWARKTPGVEASVDTPPGGGEFSPSLGDVLRIEVRSSLIELLLPEEPLAGESTLLAIGHPAFDADPASTEELAEETGVLAAAATRSGEDAGLLRGGIWERGFATLPETRAEVRGIAQYFEDSFGEKAPSVLLERRKASREALIELAPKARWLHVATHGWFAPESVRSSADPQPEPASALAGARQNPLVGLRLDESERVRGMSPMLLCGLALAGANLPVNSVGRIPGLVTAQEIAALDLRNCELAVLSACDTNVGVRRAGQGVASLQKALHMAGARSVITSLWKVPDEATKDLMIDFYRRLWIEKKPKHQALWEAKTKLRNAKDESGKPKYTPRDWAAWVLTGDPD